MPAILALLARRLGSAVVGAVILGTAILVALLALVAVLWFTATAVHFQLGWLLLIASFTFSLLGSLSIGILPPLGKKLCRIEQVETRPSPERTAKITLKLLLFYLIPASTLYSLIFFTDYLQFGDRASSELLLPLQLVAANFATLLIPISIVLGRGAQGIHDVASGLSVRPKGSSEIRATQLSRLLAPSIAYTALIAFLLTPIELSVFTRFGASPTPLMSEEEVTAVTRRLDGIFLAVPAHCRRAFSAVDFRWWVDLTCGLSERIAFGKSLGLKGSKARDVLGVGFRLFRQSAPIQLISLDGNEKKEVHAGTPILSAVVFTDVGVFQYSENKTTIRKLLFAGFHRQGLLSEFGVIHVRITRMIKVAFLVVSVYDDHYWTPRQIWRNADELETQYSVRVFFRNPFGGKYISSFELS